LLIVGADPSDSHEYVLAWESHNRPFGFNAAMAEADLKTPLPWKLTFVDADKDYEADLGLAVMCYRQVGFGYGLRRKDSTFDGIPGDYVYVFGGREGAASEDRNITESGVPTP